MKNFVIIFMVVTLLFSCKKKDDENGTPSGTVNDRDVNVYPTVKICDQVWMAKNLNVSTYRNGDPIPQVTGLAQWANLTTGAWCYYENKTSNGTVYGKLYNWYAVNDPRGLAPAGWHIPSDAEWTTLTTCLGGESVAGGKMKSTGTSLLTSPNTAATNSSSFSGMPGGARDYNGNFDSIGEGGFWWSNTVYGIDAGWSCNLDYDFGSVFRNGSNKVLGFSVRCIRD